MRFAGVLRSGPRDLSTRKGFSKKSESSRALIRRKAFAFTVETSAKSSR